MTIQKNELEQNITKKIMEDNKMNIEIKDLDQIQPLSEFELAGICGGLPDPPFPDYLSDLISFSDVSNFITQQV